jgi:hypothetical protein
VSSSETRLTLVVLAAGLGSRFGGLKQLEPLGPGGETLLDYTVRDARRAGFERVVFIIRHEFEAEFRAKVGARFEGKMELAYAFQELSSLPDGKRPPPARVRPWGTGHALWCARELLPGPCAVVNADDFYGAPAYVGLAAFLRAQSGAAAAERDFPVYALAGYPLGLTLSEHGAVSRGICEVDAEGWLRGITERSGITPSELGPGRSLTAETVVSMNCWAFTPEFWPQLDAAWRAFIAEKGGDERAEFYLPAAVDRLLVEGSARVRVLPTASPWFGVTFREDAPQVRAALAALPRD